MNFKTLYIVIFMSHFAFRQKGIDTITVGAKSGNSDVKRGLIVGISAYSASSL